MLIHQAFTYDLFYVEMYIEFFVCVGNTLLDQYEQHNSLILLKCDSLFSIISTWGWPLTIYTLWSITFTYYILFPGYLSIYYCQCWAFRIVIVFNKQDKAIHMKPPNSTYCGNINNFSLLNSIRFFLWIDHVLFSKSDKKKALASMSLIHIWRQYHV